MKLGFFLLLSFLFFVGCEQVHQGAQEVGKPVGAVMKTVGGVTEGAVEGYQDSPQENPLNR